MDEKAQKMKEACMICCPMCDEKKCVGRFNCSEIKRFLDKDDFTEVVRKLHNNGYSQKTIINMVKDIFKSIRKEQIEEWVYE